MDSKPLVVAVTKGFTIDEIKALYDKCYRHFGESRLQEAEAKMAKLPPDCKWHFIGTLQSKKVSKVVGRFVLIHSVDSVELAEKISKASHLMGICQEILLQVNISGEESKHGFSVKELEDVFPHLVELPHVKLRGLMTMAPKDDPESARLCFSKTKELQESLQSRYALLHFSETSMGMSDDYKIAIECGATMLRLGRALKKGQYNENVS